MRKAKITNGFIFISLIIIAVISISFATARTRKPASCQETLDECCQKKSDRTGSELLYDQLSRQFISAVKTGF